MDPGGPAASWAAARDAERPRVPRLAAMRCCELSMRLCWGPASCPGPGWAGCWEGESASVCHPTWEATAHAPSFIHRDFLNIAQSCRQPTHPTALAPSHRTLSPCLCFPPSLARPNAPPVAVVPRNPLAVARSLNSAAALSPSPKQQRPEQPSGAETTTRSPAARVSTWHLKLPPRHKRPT